MKSRQDGATTVEFALVFLLFLMFTLAIVDASRMLYAWNAANEATRAGARYAVVCADSASSARVVAKMQALMPQITSTNVNVVWSPDKCDFNTCEAVTVSLTGLNFKWITPVPNGLADPTVLMSGFSTYLPREMMTYDPRIC